MARKWIYWLNEVGQEHNDIVGKKCANLGELTKAGFHVPPGYALSVEAYNRFMNETDATKHILKYLENFKADPNDLADTLKYEKASQDIREIVESIKMPSDMEGTVRSYYENLCKIAGRKDIYVATRSAGPASHPGQYETYLNVSGADDVVFNVIRVWSSTFNARSLIARARLNLPLHYDPIGVAVLTMVDSKAAGVMFTLNPVNGDVSKVAIEGSFGFGEAVVSGNVTPDTYLVDKVTMIIEEKVISDKGSEFVYNPKTKEMEYIELPSDKKKVQCLEDREVIELAKLAKMVEEHFGCPQDVEWAISKSLPFPENIFLVQARPETVWGKKRGESVLGKKTGLEMLFEKALTPTKIR
ncbi:MAG TPA: phenylphosphate synthase subunit beta [Deltaproteobacteria bacterium]|nr:phenylphosphate synthase subunit beta [Deltaproteobacteria bacterium]